MKIFLDCDGVLADFDAAAMRVCGELPRQAAGREAAERVWKQLRRQPDFFFHLPKMSDADALVEGVQSLGFTPVILTGTPHWDEAADQKLRWARRHYPELKMITCRSSEKYLHGASGDVLIDDWERYQELWRSMGGRFILHRSATDSLRELKSLLQNNDR